MHFIEGKGEHRDDGLLGTPSRPAESEMLGQGWVSAPSRAKQRIKPGVVRFVCNPALGKWQHEGQ